MINVPNKVKEADMQVAKILGRHLGRGYADNNRFLTIEDLKDREIFILEKDNSKTPITYDMFVRVFNNIPNIMIKRKVVSPLRTNTAQMNGSLTTKSTNL